MTRKRIGILWPVILAAASHGTMALAGGNPWGGVGKVTTSASSITAGGSVQIQYQITGSLGTGTAGFTCNVTDPSGSIFTATVGGIAWSGGTGTAAFSYPSDFGGSLIPINTLTSGNYAIQCYWPISGYGVNGDVDAAGASFVVTNGNGHDGNPWGGVGRVTTSASSVAAGASVQIQYQITGSGGTGTTPFTCNVTDPNGSIFTATANGIPWSDGTATTTFTYPGDFGGSLLAINTQTLGNYGIQCYWPISGYGVNGPVDAASASFAATSGTSGGNPWGGVGKVTTSASSITAGGSVQIQYQITGSGGTGTASFTCNVTDPSGSIFTATAGGIAWSGGTGTAVFSYPSGFGGSLIPINTLTSGNYAIQCYWPISGYGVNGDVDAAGASFAVTNGTAHDGNPWGGVGHVTTSASSVAAGASVQIQYQITGSLGTGTAGFTCDVTDPNGSIFTATAGGIAWSGGIGTATFSYPGDFGGSLLAINTQTSGSYAIQCYWPISGYGVNGPVDAASSSFAVGAIAPTPVLSGLSPSSATAGGAAFTLTVNGSGFLSGATVDWNGSPLSTNYISGNQLTATVAANLIAVQGSASVTVVNPGGLVSNAATFLIASLPVPVLSGLSPSSAAAEGPAFTLTVNGSGFLSGATVDWNGSPLSTSYLGGTQLTAAVAANLIAAQGSVSITVVNPGGLVSNVATFTIAPERPVINPGGVVNGASFVAPVVPGSIVSAFGSFLLSSALGSTQLPLPTNISGLSLQFGGGTLAPLFFVSGRQVNLQVPWELSGQSQSALVAAVNSLDSAPQTVNLAPFAPAIFTANAGGSGQGAILDSSYRLVDSTNPATAGTTYVLIYCTGLGAVTNQPATGSPALSDPLSWSGTPTVTIGGVTANVQFSGLAPGFVGLYQVNVQVPVGSDTGPVVPVVISMGGMTSNTVTIAVQ